MVFECKHNVFAFRDVLFVEKYPVDIIEKMIARKVRMKCGGELEFHVDKKTGDELDQILVIFRDSFPSEYPYECQWENAALIGNEDGDADRFIAEFKAYIFEKERRGGDAQRRKRDSE